MDAPSADAVVYVRCLSKDHKTEKPQTPHGSPIAKTIETTITHQSQENLRMERTEKNTVRFLLFQPIASNHPHYRDIVKAMPKKSQPTPKSFEDALAELEKILSEIEGGEVGLEQSLSKYERGSFLIQHCRAVLATAEKQIELLSKDSDGNLASEPLEDESEDEGDEQAD